MDVHARFSNSNSMYNQEFFKKKSSKAAYKYCKMREFLVRFKKWCELLQQFASDKVWSDKLSEIVLSLFWFLYISSSVQTNYFENLLKLPLSPFIYCIFKKNIIELAIFLRSPVYQLWGWLSLYSIRKCLGKIYLSDKLFRQDAVRHAKRCYLIFRQASSGQPSVIPPVWC